MADTEKTACEFKASIGEDGQLIIEAVSEECQQMAIQAASEHGVDVKHVKPKSVNPDATV